VTSFAADTIAHTGTGSRRSRRDEHGNDGAEKLQGDREQERQDHRRIAIICPFLSRETAEYMVNGHFKSRFPGTFAFNLPFTLEMLIARGPGLKSLVKINNVLVFAAANVTGGVNH
jgi:hypothetical protein